MKVFCALITMTGRSGRVRLMRGRRSKTFSSGITTSVMTRSPSPSLTQRHSVAAFEVRAHRIAGPRQRLVEHGADRRVVVGDEDIAERHVTSVLMLMSAGPGQAGISTRKTVRRGCDLHSMTPPWSPMILATSARPRPVPLALVVTNGSKRCGIMSSGTPGPLSRTQNSSGSVTLLSCPAPRGETPGLKAVVSMISPSGASPIDSAAFLTRLRNTWTSWSRLA